MTKTRLNIVLLALTAKKLRSKQFKKKAKRIEKTLFLIAKIRNPEYPFEIGREKMTITEPTKKNLKK